MTPTLASARIIARACAYCAADRRDAHAMSVYARMRLTVRGRHAILSGIAGFQRQLEE